MTLDKKSIISIIITVLLSVCIFFEFRYIYFMLMNQSILDYKHKIEQIHIEAETNVTVNPDNFVIDLAPEADTSGDVIGVGNYGIRVNGRFSNKTEDNVYYYTSITDSNALHAVCMKTFDGNVVTDRFLKASERYRDTGEPFELSAYTYYPIDEDTSVTAYRQTYDSDFIPEICVHYSEAFQITKEEKVPAGDYYMLFLYDPVYCTVICCDEPISFTDEAPTVHYKDISQTNLKGWMNTYELDAIENTKKALLEKDKEGVYDDDDGTQSVPSTTEAEEPTGPDYTKVRQELLGYLNQVFDEYGVSKDHKITLDLQSKAAKSAQFSVSGDQESYNYSNDGFRISKVVCNNATDGSTVTLEVSIENIENDTQGFVLGAYALDANRKLLGIRVFDYTNTPLYKDSKTTVTCNLDKTTVADPSKIKYVQLEIR